MGKIILTAFPRSASRFARAVFETFYGPENYEEGLCKINYLKKANAFTIVRKPEEAIPSWVAAVENYFEGFAGFTVENVVEESIKFYIEWMEAIEERYKYIYVTTFEKITQETQNELDKISLHFDLPKVQYDKDKVVVDYKHIPGGNPETELSKNCISHPDFYRAIEAYNKVIILVG